MILIFTVMPTHTDKIPPQGEKVSLQQANGKAEKVTFNRQASIIVGLVWVFFCSQLKFQTN